MFKWHFFLYRGLAFILFLFFTTLCQNNRKANTKIYRSVIFWVMNVFDSEKYSWRTCCMAAARCCQFAQTCIWGEAWFILFGIVYHSFPEMERVHSVVKAYYIKTASSKAPQASKEQNSLALFNSASQMITHPVIKFCLWRKYCFYLAGKKRSQVVKPLLLIEMAVWKVLEQL